MIAIDPSKRCTFPNVKRGPPKFRAMKVDGNKIRDDVDWILAPVIIFDFVKILRDAVRPIGQRRHHFRVETMGDLMQSERIELDGISPNFMEFNEIPAAAKIMNGVAKPQRIVAADNAHESARLVGSSDDVNRELKVRSEKIVDKTLCLKNLPVSYKWRAVNWCHRLVGVRMNEGTDRSPPSECRKGHDGYALSTIVFPFSSMRLVVTRSAISGLSLNKMSISFPKDWVWSSSSRF